jgi:hypothetical protein
MVAIAGLGEAWLRGRTEEWLERGSTAKSFRSWIAVAAQELLFLMFLFLNCGPENQENTNSSADKKQITAGLYSLRRPLINPFEDLFQKPGKGRICCHLPKDMAKGSPAVIERIEKAR